MEEIIPKEELNKLMSIYGMVRGVEIKGEMEFVLRKEGEKGLKELENTMEKIGHSLKYKNIRTMDFYPFGLEAVLLTTIKRLFNYGDDEFIEMGKWGAKLSMAIRLIMNNFFSIEKVIEEGPKLWKRLYNQGELNITEFDKENKKMIIRIENFNFHPIHCKILLGVLPQLIQMILKSEAKCEEIKCIYKNDKYHEFLLKW